MSEATIMRVVECAGGIVVNPSLRQIIIIKNQIGRTTFPKGTCRLGETKERTALREITEETGVRELEIRGHLGTLRRLGYTATQSDVPSALKVIDMFHCITVQTELCPIEDDAVAARWISPEKLHTTLTWPEEIAFFEQHQVEMGL